MSLTKTAWWRTAPSGTEGTNTIYVDGNFGSDIFGDGTRAYPVKTLTCAWNRTTKPTLIVCRGLVYGNIVGDHNCGIVADYYGAAVYEGNVEDESFSGMPWFGYYSRMIVKHAKGKPESDIVNALGSYASFWGCGRATSAYYVREAHSVCGLASSPLTIVDSTLWRGGIGSGNNIVYSKIQRCDGCGVCFGSYWCSSSNPVYNITVYDLPYATRDVTKSANTLAFYGMYDLFSKVDFILEHSDTFTECFFAADCNYYVADIKDGSETKGKRVLLKWQHVEGQETTFTANLDDDDSATHYSLTVSGDTITGVYRMFNALVTNGNMAAACRDRFVRCVFSSQTAELIFNNAEDDDFTLKEGSAAIINGNSKYGAMPPAINIKVYDTLSGSDLKLNCFDNRTMSGCLAINDGVLSVDDLSGDTKGFIATKILKIDPFENQIAGIYSLLKNDLKKTHFVVANTENDTTATLGTTVITLNEENPEATLEEGSYLILSGKCYYSDKTLLGRDMIFVKPTDIENSLNKVTYVDEETKILVLNDANIVPSIGVRCRSMLYNNGNPYCRVYSVNSNQTNKLLMPNVTYLNCGDKNITYNARTVIPGESFVATENITTYSGTDLPNDYFVCAMFDDRKFSEGETVPDNYPVVPIEPWCFGLLWGDYFVLKRNGYITSANDEKKSSGNYMAYKSAGNQLKNYGSDEYASIINQPYVQLGLFVEKLP